MLIMMMMIMMMMMMMHDDDDDDDDDDEEDDDNLIIIKTCSRNTSRGNIFGISIHILFLMLKKLIRFASSVATQNA